jgi:prepilin-type N-terminal cleavage/methylation domain-containing protein
MNAAANECKRGFTLVELLVVISIITMLLGILLPALGKVRQIAKRTYCCANLHNVGLGLKMYLDNNRYIMPPGRNVLGQPTELPDARYMPYSVTDLSQTIPFPNHAPILKYLGPYLSVPDEELSQIGNRKIYCKVLSCPADYYGSMNQYFFKNQTSSYEYDPSDRVAGKMVDMRAFRSGDKPSDLAAMSDFEAFHGTKPVSSDISDPTLIAAQADNTAGSYNYLFCDIHVGDRKGY